MLPLICSPRFPFDITRYDFISKLLFQINENVVNEYLATDRTILGNTETILKIKMSIN